jgi:sugar/nucleoside kinase (ribokinase family)
VGELGPGAALAYEAGVVGACGQGWLRDVDPDTGSVSATPWRHPGADLEGVHVVFVSEADMAGDADAAQALLAHVPMVVLTRGWRGAELLTREGVLPVPTRPSEEVAATGAGAVFAAAFLIGYTETSDPEQAAAFACCVASCCLEAPGTTGLGDRAEVERRRERRERWLEDPESE